MIIQCPKCKSRYRTKVSVEAHSPLQATCTKCGYRFLVVSEQSEALKMSTIPKILIVDDARFFRELTLDLLAKRDAELSTANSAKEAWEKLHQEKIDLLIVDVNLPDINGLELISKIRADAKINNIAILCISGVYRKDVDALKALRAGADDFISKSFQPDELNQRIDKLLQQ
jgi:DNA-binding response OmpR family regulator